MLIERRVQMLEEADWSIRASCAPVEEAMLSAQKGVVVPRPKRPSVKRARSAPPVEKFNVLAPEEKMPVSESREKLCAGEAALPKEEAPNADAKIPFAKVEVAERPVMFRVGA